jgi:hypothetical protein
LYCLLNWRSQARHLALREDTKVSRSQTVANFFPRLAYTTSDVIVMVSREPFYNRRYLDRCILLAKRANSGIANVQRPALILVGNKLPGDEVVLDVDASTTAFFDCWGDDAQELDSFFSAILCVYIPHKNSIWTDPKDPSRRLDGAVACKQQLDKLRNILAVLGRRRAAGKPIDPGAEEAPATTAEAVTAGSGASSTTSSSSSSSSWSSGAQAMSQRHGVWFGLLPRVVDELNAGRGVDVGRLLDEAWQEASRARAAEDEGMFDAFVAFTASLRPPRALSATSDDYTTDVLERYSQFRSLAVRVSCRLLACRLRAIDRGLLVPDKVQTVVEETVAAVVAYLDSVAPCTAAYDPSGDKGTTAVDRPEQAVHCLQEARAHSTHRTCVRVRGGKGIWGTIAFFVPFNDTWAGRHRPPRTEPVDVEACVEMVTSLAKKSDVSFLEALVELRKAVSGPDSLIRIGLARLGLPTSPHDGSPIDVSHQLLPPCAPLSDDAFNALSIIPGVDAPASMPYCVGCGVKLTAATAGPDGTKPASVSSSSSAAPSGSAGLLGALASMLGLGQAGPSPSPEAVGAAPAVSAAGIMLEATAEAGERPGGSFRHDTSASAATTATPSADLQALLEAVTGDGPLPGSIVDPTSDQGGAGDGSETDKTGPPKHNVWLGLCPRCWSAAYTEPASRQAGEVFVPLPSGQESVFD